MIVYPIGSLKYDRRANTPKWSLAVADILRWLYL